MMLKHALAPLLAPASVALIGATEREGALGRLVWLNLAAGYRALLGSILNANQDMLGLAGSLGFVQSGRDGDVVTVARPLQ